MLRVDLLVEWKFHLCSAWAGAGSVTARGCSGACVRRRLVRHLAAGMVVIGTARRGSPGTAWEARGAFSFLAYLEIIKNIKNYWFITVIMQNIHLCLLPVYQPISSLGWQGPKPASKPLSDWLLNLSQPWICLSSCMWLLVETVIECGTETGTKLECTNLALNLSQSVTIWHNLAQTGTNWHKNGTSGVAHWLLNLLKLALPETDLTDPPICPKWHILIQWRLDGTQRTQWVEH